MISVRRLAWCAFASLTLPVVVVASACSSSSSNGSGAVVPGGEDGSTLPENEGGVTADAKSDGTTDAPKTTCDGACKTTSLVADFGGKKRTLVRAQFGTQQGDAGAELHTESHLGGAAACPSQSSPTPDYTLIVSAIPRGQSGIKLSDRDGVTSAFFDFKSDLGLASPSGITKAVSVNITVVAEDTASPPAWVAVDVSAMFREGEVTGHMYAEYCASLSQ
jgi:hypothetical protein